MKMLQVHVVAKLADGDFGYYPVVLPLNLIDPEKTSASMDGGTTLVLVNGNTLWVDQPWSDIMEDCGLDPYAIMEE